MAKFQLIFITLCAFIFIVSSTIITQDSLSSLLYSSLKGTHRLTNIQNFHRGAESQFNMEGFEKGIGNIIISAFEFLADKLREKMFEHIQLPFEMKV